jgi:predicted GNAT family N-acyltransferase
MSTTRFQIIEASWPKDKAALRQVRETVFVVEQNVPTELEWDGKDDQARHWLALDDSDQPIGTVRMQIDGHIGRMAVISAYRHRGVGSSLLQAAVLEASKQQLFQTYLHAQSDAIGFYERAGFIVEGEEFLDAGIPHRTMRKQLADHRTLGVHGGKFSIQDHQQAVLDIIQQTERQLQIISYALDATIYDTPEVVEVISNLARKSRYTNIQLLIINNDRIIQGGHRLVNLQRRLPTSIFLRILPEGTREIPDNVVIADRIGVICQSSKDPDLIWANYNNRPIAEDHGVKFDELWQHAVVDNELRQLDL